MGPNARSDLFNFELPKSFFPENITKKFNGYVERLPRIYNDVKSIVNESIQSITIPNINYDPPEQQRAGFTERKRGRKILHRASTAVEELYDKTFTITMRAKDGYINYWIMLDLFLYWYSFPNVQQYVFDLPVSIYDSFGDLVFIVKLKSCLFTGLSEYELNFSSNSNELKTFECNFSFNELEFQFLKT